MIVETKFIRNLALDLKGNTLILFSRVEGHGQPLYELINNNSVETRHVFFVHGGVATEDREKVREITEKEDNAIIVASYGTFSTGINIKNLHNVILLLHPNLEYGISNLLVACSGKAITKQRQLSMTLLTTFPTRHGETYTLNHLIERIKVYNEENFNYDIVNIPLKN